MTPTSIMRRHVGPARALMLGAALAVGLAGCGDGEGTRPDDGMPLGAIDAMLREAAEAQEGEEAEQRAEVEELVAECMAEQGFEYFPVDDASREPDAMAPEDMNDLEFAERWGYGIITNPWEDVEEEGPGPAAGDEDPNQPIVEAMSESEQDAYYEALLGPERPAETDAEGEYLASSWEEMGCRGSAHHEVYGFDGSGAPRNDTFIEFWEEIRRVYEATANDERVLAAEADWATCMADAGHPEVAKITDGEQTIREQVDLLWTEGYADVQVNPTDEAVRAAERAIHQRLAAMIPVEIELAVTDFTCREEVGYDRAYNEVSLVLQQEFVDAHRAELEAWMAEQAAR